MKSILKYAHQLFGLVLIATSTNSSLWANRDEAKLKTLIMTPIRPPFSAISEPPVWVAEMRAQQALQQALARIQTRRAIARLSEKMQKAGNPKEDAQ